LKRITDVLAMPIEQKRYIKEKPYAVGPVEEIKIRDLSFSYRDKKEDVLKNIDMEFRKGKIYAVVSFSGGGKSTLLDLMANIRVPDSGRVLFNDLEIEGITPKILRDKMGYMNQEPLIFHDTLKENVIFFNREVGQDRIDEALGMAAIRDFAYSLPAGLNTGLGERGLTVSGGERQRIGLARVFLKDPEILLLDEATNSLDYKTEGVIYDNLKRIKKDKIIIVAAHRLSSIVDFDEIIVLHDGKVEERGVHGELMQKRGIYYSLYRLQEQNEERKARVKV
jgi:ABC-type multidrug transport system fused ATPase/permease subunit